MKGGEDEKMKSRQEFLLRTRPPLQRPSCDKPTLWRSYLSPSEGLFITDNQNGSSALTASQQLQVMIEIICSTRLIMRHNTTKWSIMKTMKVAGGGERGRPLWWWWWWLFTAWWWWWWWWWCQGRHQGLTFTPLNGALASHTVTPSLLFSCLTDPRICVCACVCVWAGVG